MRCEEAICLLNARVDGGVNKEAAHELDAHLAACLQCRNEAEAVSAMHAELQSVFADRRAAAARFTETAVKAIRSAGIAPCATSTIVHSAPHVAWGQVLAGLAAGFLLAIVLFRRWHSDSDELALPTSVESIGRLAFASGSVEVRPINLQKNTEFFTCPAGSPIEQNSIVRTGADALCEISLEDGRALRLDRGSEVSLQLPETVEIRRGRLWSNLTPHDDKLVLRVYECPVTAESPAKVAVECEPNAARLIVVDGTVSVKANQKSVKLGPNQQVLIANGRVEEGPEPCDALLETAWVNRVLALSGAEHPEFTERVNQLLARIGAAKVSLLYEDELRTLGVYATAPLLSYLKSSGGDADPAQRATAARIVADVAESQWIGDLITLLADSDADVRFQAARGLERLTGRDQGLPPAAWQTASRNSCQSAHQQWTEWWAANRDRYPVTVRKISAPF
jgi:hypothetical protein